MQTCSCHEPENKTGLHDAHAEQANVACVVLVCHLKGGLGTQTFDPHSVVKMLLRQLHHQGLQGWCHVLEVRGGFVQRSMQLHGCFGYVQKSLCFFHLFLQHDLAWRSFNLFALGSNLGNQLRQRLGHFSFFSLLLLAALSFWDAGESCSPKRFFTQLLQQLFSNSP